MRARLSPIAASWLVALALGTIACAIFAVLLSKARAQDTPAVTVTVFCGHARDMEATLAKKFGELPVGRGQISPDALIVVYARPDGQSFTMLRVMASGKACVMTSGQGWEGFFPARGSL